MDEGKTCSKCEEWKPLTEFHTYGGKPKARCKPCYRESNLASQKKHRAARTEYLREWAQTHPEKVREYNRRQYAKADLGSIRAYRAEWREKNRDDVREKQRIYWETYDYRPTSEQMARSNHRRRSRLRDAFVEDVSLEALILRDEGRCGICGGDLENANFHVDHIIPLACGGTHEMANVQLAHPTCNLRKGRTPPR